MMTLFKMLLIGFVACLGACGTGAAVLGGYLVTGGIASVKVRTPDTNLSLPVPLRLVDMGLGVASVAGREAQIGRELRHELRDVEAFEEVRPALHSLIDEIGSLPSGELVRVRTANESVVIEQRLGRIRIDVDAPDTEVSVTVPKRAVERIGHRVLRLVDDV